MPTDLFSLRSEHVPSSARVVAFTGTEAISRPFHFEVFLIVPQAEGELDPDVILGERATLEINDEEGTARRWYHGAVASLELQHDLGVDLLYRLEIVPRLWSLSLSHHSRVYANETFHKVVERVMKTIDLKKDEDYSIAFPPGRPYEHLTEYRESHFDFVSRVMEREGYYYYFEQRDDREFLVIANTKDQQPEASPPGVAFFPTGDADTSGVEALHSFRVRSVAMPTHVRLREYDPQQPDANLTGNSDVPHSVIGRVDYFGENYTSQGDGNRLAGYRKEEIQTRLKRFFGNGRVFNLASGHFFDLENHGRLDGRYLAVELRHTGSNFSGADSAQQRLGFDAAINYRVDVVAIPGDQQFRPARITPVPRIYGVEEAVVCGAATSPYAQVDSHGRYKVKILFDEGDARDGKASTWVRMIQPHGGNPEGFHFPLRKGTEVLLVYLGGDPDRPVIAGTAHNTNKPSVVNEANHTLNVIHTGSDNRIEIDDAQGAQYVNLYSPPQNSRLHLGAHAGPGGSHNFVLTTDGDGLLHTGGNHDVTVGGDMAEDVVGNLTEDYHSNQTTHVFGDFTETVDGSETRTVSSGSNETIHAGHQQTIDGGSTESVTGDHTRRVSGAVTHTVGGDVTETIAGSETRTVTGGITTTTPGSYKIVATAGMQVIAPGGWQLIAPGGTTTVDSFFDKTGGKSIDAFGFKMSITGAKVDIVPGLSAGYTAIKMDLTQLKLEYNPVKVANKATELKTVGQVIQAGYLALHGVAFCMIT